VPHCGETGLAFGREAGFEFATVNGLAYGREAGLAFRKRFRGRL
jgi:hypothetical protein